MGRVLFDVTDLVSLPLLDEELTGIPKVIVRCLAAFLDDAPGITPVFFSRITRRFCRVDGKRLLARDREYMTRIRPPARDTLGRMRAYFGVLRAGRITPGADDTILVLGGGWDHPRRHSYLFGVNPVRSRVIWFCHDLIPALHPHFTLNSEIFQREFVVWLDAALAHRHRFVCASRFVEGELRRYAGLRGMDVDVSVVPLAHELPPAAGAVGERIARLADRATALYVSSIGLRKNQLALVRAWDRLRAEFDGRLPTLLLVGGALDAAPVEDYLRRSDNAGGSVVLVGSVTDAELAFLYGRCTFTVYPSLTEGWGLPIGESLWMGKPCVSSHLASMPEVAGEYAAYFDPRDEEGMLSALRRAICGETVAPPPRERLRSWRQVAADIAALL